MKTLSCPTSKSFLLTSFLTVAAAQFACAAVIANFNSPSLVGDPDGYTFYAPGFDGYKVNLSQVTSSNNGLTVNPGFIATASGSDAVGLTRPTNITSPGGQYGYMNAGGGRAASFITENAFEASSIAGTYTLSVDLGRRSDGIGSNSGRYIFGFLSNYAPGQTSSTTFTNFNTFNSGDNAGTFSFGTNGNLLGTRIVNYQDIAAGTFSTFTTNYTAAAGESLKAFIIYDNTSGGFGQSAIDNLSFTVVPEPGTFTMLLGGFGMLLLFRRPKVRAF